MPKKKPLPYSRIAKALEKARDHSNPYRDFVGKYGPRPRPRRRGIKRPEDR